MRGKTQGNSSARAWLNHRIQIFGEGHDQERFPLLIKILDALEFRFDQTRPRRASFHELTNKDLEFDLINRC